MTPDTKLFLTTCELPPTEIDTYRRPALTVIVPDTIDAVPLDDRTAYRRAIDTDIDRVGRCARRYVAFDMDSVIADHCIGRAGCHDSHRGNLINTSCNRVTDRITVDDQSWEDACRRTFIEIARAAVTMLLPLIAKLVAVAPAATPVVTDVIGAGAAVAVVVEAPVPARIPNVVFSDAVVPVAVGMLRPVELPTMFRSLIMRKSAELTTVVANATRMTDVNVTVFAAVFWSVRFLFVPPVFGLSPSMVTASAPLSSISPRPVGVAPATVTSCPPLAG
jgi:hypothetical protein